MKPADAVIKAQTAERTIVGIGDRIEATPAAYTPDYENHLPNDQPVRTVTPSDGASQAAVGALVFPESDCHSWIWRLFDWASGMVGFEASLGGRASSARDTPGNCANSIGLRQ